MYILLDFIQKFSNLLFHGYVIFGGSLIQQLMKEFDSDETEYDSNLFQLSDNMFQFVENVLGVHKNLERPECPK